MPERVITDSSWTEAEVDCSVRRRARVCVSTTVERDLYPSRCRVRGRWLWNLANFEAWNNSEIFRSVKLVGTIRGNLRFIYR